MSNLSEERMKEMEESKEQVKKMNVNAVADLLLKVQDRQHAIQEENIDLKRMCTQNNQDIATLRGEIAALKVMGFRGQMGTGSTVHNANE